jgi:predicted dehydrogenase
VGVIGCGYIGAVHVESLRRLPCTKVMAVAETDAATAQAKAEALGVPRAYSDWRELVADPQIEVVHNCTPNHLHFEVNKAILEAGKPVVSEKPLAMTSAESGELVAVAERLRIPTAINFNYRYYPLVQHAHHLVRRGDVGRVNAVVGYYQQDWLFKDTDYNWRLETQFAGSSRCMADIGSHWCDLAQFVSGRKIREVMADVATFIPVRKKPVGKVETFTQGGGGQATTIDCPIDTEDYGSVLIRFDDGSRGTFNTAQVYAGRKNRITFEVYGSTNSVGWNHERPNELWIGHRDEANGLLFKDPSLIDSPARAFAHLPGGHNEGYESAPMNLFLDFYGTLEQPPRASAAGVPDFRTGHNIMQICEAIMESARKRSWVRVPDMAEVTA